MNFFNTKNSTIIIKDYIESSQRGTKTKLAEAMKCSSSYLTQVLNEKAVLSLEQAIEFSKFFQFFELQIDYFIALIQFERAANPKLKEYFNDQLVKIRNKQFDLDQRLKLKNTLSDQEKSIYYSSWHYPVIHISTTIADLDKPEKIAKCLNLTLKRVLFILDSLKQWGLVESKNGRYLSTNRAIHLDKHSIFDLMNHQQFRLASISKLNDGLEDDLRFSAVISLSQSDLDQIKEILIQAIEQSKKIIVESKEEELCLFNVDCLKFLR